MHPTEPPSGAPATVPSRPNLLSPPRCGADVQQQILARLEIKAAEQARLMRMARQSLRVAGLTTLGIAIVVAMLAIARHRAAPPLGVVPMPATAAQPAAIAPAPALPVNNTTVTPAKAEEGPLASLLETQAAPAPAVKAAAPRPKMHKVAPVRDRLAHIKNKLPRHRSAVLHLKKPAKAAAVAKLAAPPVDTDVNLLSAILLHSSRPAVVPPAFQRPPCTAKMGHLPALPCTDVASDP